MIIDSCTYSCVLFCTNAWQKQQEESVFKKNFLLCAISLCIIHAVRNKWHNYMYMYVSHAILQTNKQINRNPNVFIMLFVTLTS